MRGGSLNTVLFLLIFDNIALKLEKVGLAIFFKCQSLSILTICGVFIKNSFAAGERCNITGEYFKRRFLNSLMNTVHL